jgi:hypothetical protein
MHIKGVKLQGTRASAASAAKKKLIISIKKG